MAETDNPYQDKIKKDEENLAKLRVGTANQQLINAAYLGARQEPPAVMTWMNAAESGLTSFTEAIDKSRKAREAEIDKMNANIDTQIDTLTTAGYSLGETYYSAANEYTKQLREKYLAADGNPEEQNKIKMELNVASQNITGTKDVIEELGIAWGANENESTLERSGLNPDEKRIVEVVTAPDGANAIWDYDKNTFVWKDPLSGETYTAKQIQDIQTRASKDFVGKEAYITEEMAEVDEGLKYRQGDAGAVAFNREKKMLLNERRITKENIEFYTSGDFTNDGTTFKKDFKSHPDFNLDDPNNVIFKALTESGKYPDKGGIDSSVYPRDTDEGDKFRVWMNKKYPNFKHKGQKLDKSGEHDNVYIKDAWDKHAAEYAAAQGGVKGFDLQDMPDPTPDDGTYTADDLMKLREQVYNAITDSSANGYDFNTSKNLIAEYMTLRQEKNFYGGSVSDLKKIDPRNYTDLQSFKDAGGNVGFAKANGYRYQQEVKDSNGRVTTKAEWIYEPGNDLYKAFSGGR